MSCTASFVLLLLRLDWRKIAVVGISGVISWLDLHRLHYLPHHPFPHPGFKIHQYFVKRWMLLSVSVCLYCIYYSHCLFIVFNVCSSFIKINSSLCKILLSNKYVSDSDSDSEDLNPMQIGNLIMREKELVRSLRSWSCASCHLSL